MMIDFVVMMGTNVGARIDHTATLVTVVGMTISAAVSVVNDLWDNLLNMRDVFLMFDGSIAIVVDMVEATVKVEAMIEVVVEVEVVIEGLVVAVI